MNSANLNSPTSVVMVYRDAISGNWYQLGSAIPISSPVSIANANAPKAMAAIAQDASGTWCITGTVDQ